MDAESKCPTAADNNPIPVLLIDLSNFNMALGWLTWNAGSMPRPIAGGNVEH